MECQLCEGTGTDKDGGRCVECDGSGSCCDDCGDPADVDCNLCGWCENELEEEREEKERKEREQP